MVPWFCQLMKLPGLLKYLVVALIWPELDEQIGDQRLAASGNLNLSWCVDIDIRYANVVKLRLGTHLY
ncbi:hypothetical protein LINPERHAP2_LOCUS1292, partial [Linum perenne]